MNPTQKLSSQQKFFFEHAGYSYKAKKETAEQGRTRGAIELAKAEDLFHDAEAYASVTFGEIQDPEFGEDGAPMWIMFIEDGNGRTLASLGGIDDNGTTYSRVVRAELASECAAELAELVRIEKGE